MRPASPALVWPAATEWVAGKINRIIAAAIARNARRTSSRSRMFPRGNLMGQKNTSAEGISLAGDTLFPLHRHLPRRHDHVSLGPPVLDDVAQDRHVLLAVGRDAVLISRAPPPHRFNPVAAFRCAKRVLGKLVELHAMPEEFMQLFVHIEGALAQPVNRRIGAKYFKIETVAVKSNYVRESLQLRNQFFRVRLEPAPKFIFLVPGHGDGHPESRNVRPAALDLVRQSQRFDVEKDFAIE